MKSIQKVFMLAIGGALALPFSASAVEVAKVNGTTLTDKDLSLSLANLNEGQRESFLKDVNNRREVLLNLVDREVLAQEAEKLELDQEPAFKEAMASFRKQLLMNMILDKKILSQVNSGAVKKYFKTNRDNYNTDQVHVQHILIRDENEAKRVAALAKDPKADFQDLAEKMSHDPSAKNNRGDLGFITRDRMVPDFTQAAFRCPVGQVVGPIHTAFGYHIIKVVEKKIGKSFEFEEVELQARAGLQRELVRNYTDNLKAQSKISIDYGALGKM